jgi:mRNA-degrading endonuclease RelE of RelBE toxin-antitoxin system
MNKLFEIVFLDEAFEFLKGLDRKHYEKILYNIRKAQTEHNPELFKKLNNEIWEFRTLYQGLQYRLLAFWDKTSTTETLVVSTHGFVKKRSNVPTVEIEKAIGQRTKYFEDKQLKNKKK